MKFVIILQINLIKLINIIKGLIMQQLTVIQGKFNYQKSIEDARKVIKVAVFSHNKERIGSFSFVNNELVLQTSDNTQILGFENIAKENIYYYIESKRLSEDVAKVAKINIYSNDGQWLLIRIEALLFNDKYKIVR